MNVVKIATLVGLFALFDYGARGCLTSAERKLDPASKAYLSPVVVTAILHRKSPVLHNKFTATFTIATVYKSPKDPKLRRRFEIVLQFWNIRRLGRTHTCGAVYRNLRLKKKYFLFADRRTWDRIRGQPPAFTGSAVTMSAVQEPVRASKKNRLLILSITRKHMARPPNAIGLVDATVNTSHRFRLKCKVRGYPYPNIEWWKDGAPVEESKRIRIRIRRKSSRLTVRRTKLSDSGRYECRASNVVSKWPAISSARISVIRNISNSIKTLSSGNNKKNSAAVRPANDSSIFNFEVVGKPCNLDWRFCLNGGTCSLYPEVGEYVCQCSEGYKGPRCENKDLSERPKNRDSIGIDATTKMLQLYWG